MSDIAKHPRRFQGDPLGDELFLLFKGDSDLLHQFRALQHNADLKEFIENHPEVNSLLFDFCQLDSIDCKRLLRANSFFEKHVSSILAVLGLYSLPYCYAGANGARVLVQSRKITEQAGKRLAETAEFVFDVCSSNSFEASNKALLSILNVRLMHAAARFYTKDSITDEVPVNQDDQLATLLAFSLVVVRGLRKMRIDVSDQSAGDYLYLWNVIGEKLGLDKSNLPISLREASTLDKDMRKREFSASDQGVALTRSLINFLDDQNGQFQGVTGDDLLYFFLEDHAQLLGIRPSATYSNSLIRTVMSTQRWLGELNGSNYQMVRKDLKRQLKSLNTELRF